MPVVAGADLAGVKAGSVIMFESFPYPEAIFVGVIVGFALLLMTVARLEKRMISEFAPIDEPEPNKQSAYTRAMNASARALSLQPCGWYGQNRGGLYKATATMWLSPDALTLVIVGGGTLARVPFKQSFLFSKPTEGAILHTSDDVGEADISGVIDQVFLLKADLAELYALHEVRLADPDIELEPFDDGAALSEFEAIRRWVAETLVHKGLASFLDEEQTRWRYTLKGSLTLYFRGFLRQLWTAKKQTKRATTRKRPGS